MRSVHASTEPESVVEGVSAARLLDALLDKDRLCLLGEFVHGFIHNINGPLQNMSMITEILTKGQDFQDRFMSRDVPELHGEWGETSARQRKRLGQLTQQICTLADMLRDFMIVHEILRHETELDLNLVVQKLGSVFNADLFFKHQVHFEMKLESNLPLLRVYGRHLVPSLMYLLKNALVAMRSSQRKELLVRTARGEGWVSVAVQDTGCGFGGCEPELFFQPFFSAWPDATTTPGGVKEHQGLGLYLARHLLSAYDCLVCLREVEGGTEAVVKIPTGSGRICSPCPSR